MAAAYVLLFVSVALAVIGALTYLALQATREREERERLELKLKHTEKMAREERTYDEIMSYIDSEGIDTELDRDEADR
jgi:hypothetical protein